MGPETVQEMLALVSPILWVCGGAIVLAIVVIRVLVLNDND